MSVKIMISPQRYVQGPDALSQIGTHLQIFEIANPLVLASPSAFKACQQTLTQSLNAGGIQYDFLEFNRECTFEEIERVKNACLDGKHDAIISCGGGKAMDAGRAAAAGYAIKVSASSVEVINPFGAGVSCIQVPTVASNDAPTASVSVVYNEHGVQEGVVLTRINPALVLVDTKIIARAPVRTLVAGMGDALATYFEADVAHRAGRQNIAGGLALDAILMMARLSLDTLMEYGVAAKREAENGIPGPALEKVVESNILHSGLGYESGGLAAAHAIAQSFTIIHEHFDIPPYHGELVAFSTLTQLIMEEKDPEYIGKILSFCKDVGLPTTFMEMGLKNVTDQILKIVAEDASKITFIASMPRATEIPDDENRYYDPNEIFDCLKKTDTFES